MGRRIVVKQKPICSLVKLWPYATDLATADFFLFSKLKEAIKGTQFADISDIQNRVTTVFKALSKDEFSKSFRKLYERCQRCVVSGGDYFEGQ